MSLAIANLRDAQHLVPIVADRLWRAWGKPDGDPLRDVELELAETLAAPDFPFILVATIDGQFAGTVSAIATDLPERPELTPWVASLWVEPEFRRAGVARALIEHAVQAMFAQHHKLIYLYAIPELQPLYLRLGWTLVEPRFGRLGVDIFTRHAPSGEAV